MDPVIILEYLPTLSVSYQDAHAPVPPQVQYMFFTKIEKYVDIKILEIGVNMTSQSSHASLSTDTNFSS